jgi:predicted O-methyltransferase YrrM
MNSIESNSPGAAYERILASIARRPAGSQAVDEAHAALLAGLVASHKPSRVLELGVGSGYATRVLLAALHANQRGELVSVDNFFDWKGRQPEHIHALQKESAGWNLVTCDETEYVSKAESASFDFIFSDGDHTRGYQNAPDVFRICRPGGILVFHDTNNPMFRLLARLPGRCRRLGFPSYHFTAKSCPGEMTDRGLLIVQKDGSRRFKMDLPARFYLMARRHLPERFRTRLLEKFLKQRGQETAR